MCKEKLDIEKYNKNLLCTDKRFRNCVSIILIDGTSMFLTNSFVLKTKKHYIVFSEHGDPISYDKTDILRIYQLKHVKIENFK